MNKIAIVWKVTSNPDSKKVEWVDTKDEALNWVEQKINEEGVAGFNIERMFYANYDKYLKEGVLEFVAG